MPPEFLQHTRAIMGEELFAQFIASFDQSTPVSIRLNPLKPFEAPEGESVPWCEEGLYLAERPNFTLDPLFHAGCYYVQEAGSMFVTHIVRHLLKEPVAALDLCAAPGGKSTALRAALQEGSVMLCNEPIRKRSMILAENVWKQGYADIHVCNNYPIDIAKTKNKFDIILADVPCSGEGMFRRDRSTVEEWSPEAVTRCAELQRSIINDIWPSLKPGGILIYSTCTFNTMEDEENVSWIARHLGADFIEIPTEESWNITGSLLPSADIPVYRFIPGKSKSEGLFCAVLRKNGSHEQTTPVIDTKCLNLITPTRTVKGKNEIPHSAEVLSRQYAKESWPTCDIDKATAIAYLRHEAIVLAPECPKGIVAVTYKGHPLGLAKNIGSRANNLYPQEWRIRTTHTEE